MSIAFVADSSCDLDPADAKRLGVHIVPNYIVMNGEVHQEGVTVTTKGAEFFLTQGGELETRPASSKDFAQKFSDLLNTHDEVVAVLISSALSQNYANATAAAQSLPPDLRRRVHLLDSRTSSVPLARMLLRGKLVVDQGGSVNQALNAMSNLRDQIVALSIPPSVQHFWKSGHVSAGNALMASLLRVCPVMTYSPEGLMVKDGTVKGSEGIRELISRLEQRLGTQPVAVTVVLAGTDDGQIKKLREALQRSRLKVQHVAEQGIGVAISAKSGPGLYGYVAEPYVEGMYF